MNHPFPVSPWPALFLVAFLTAGCTVGPDPVTPSAAMVPGQWQAPAAERLRGDVAGEALVQWWRVFEDPQLNALIELALQTNLDLRRAEARIREARARQGSVAADLFPRVDSGGSATRSRTSENAASRTAGEQDLFQFGFDARWEIDLFGGTRRAVEAAEADLAAAREARRDIWVSLLAEVSRNYLEVRGSQQRMAIAGENVAAQRRTLELTEGRRAAGLTSELAVSQARTQLAATEAQLPILDRIRQQAVHRLGVLLGKAPGELRAVLDPAAPLPRPLPRVPLGLPSDLLRRRPDVRRAEQELVAATARIGVATADLFPRFSLTGTLGRQSLDAGDLILPGSTFWSLGPVLRWPVFDAGRIRANIEVQNARQEETLARYEQVVLLALEDVENALVAFDNEQESRVFLAQSVESSQRSVEIAAELYARGLSGFLDVLVGQRTLYQSQDLLAASDQRLATNLVALFKALGGGWEGQGK